MAQTDAAGRAADEHARELLGPAVPGLSWLVLQKGVHVFLFVVFGVLLAIPSGWRPLAVRGAWCVGAGALAESLQLLSAGRSAEVSDALLNIASGIAATWIAGRIMAPSEVRIPDDAVQSSLRQAP